jgi:tRNA (cmo5U34)-methyltransferase
VLDVGDGLRAEPGSWSFGGEVAERFDAHIARSVPYYAETHRLVEQLSDVFVSPGSRVYDLGCSTGALTARLAARHHDRTLEVIGVDREPQMVASARRRCVAFPSVTIVDADLASFDLLSADLVVAHYTLQFMTAAGRRHVVERAARALDGGGAFLLFEKVKSSDAQFDALMIEQYHEWKRSQGYTDAEIGAKARSLEGVLEPLTPEQNRDMLRAAGFRSATTVYRWLNWEGLLATAG